MKYLSTVLANLAATLDQTNRINFPIRIEERQIIPNTQEVLKPIPNDTSNIISVMETEIIDWLEELIEFL